MEGHAAETRAKEITQRERARRDKIKKSEKLNNQLYAAENSTLPALNR